MCSSDTRPSSERAFAPGAQLGRGVRVVLGCEILRQVRILSVGIVRASHDSCNNAADWFGVDARMEVGCFSRTV